MLRFTPLVISMALVGCGAPATDTSAPAKEEAPAGSESKPSGSATKVDASLFKVSLNEEGTPQLLFKSPDMHCEACAASIVQAVKETPGVVDVEADAETKVVSVTVDEETFEAKAVVEAVVDAGFDGIEPVEADAS